MSKHLEQQLQERLVTYLNARGILFCASAGGMRTNMQTAIRMKRAGYKKGFPDIFIYQPYGHYYGMAIEVKCGSYPTIEQRAWCEALKLRGYKAIIVPATLDFNEAYEYMRTEIDKYMKGAIE